MVEISSQGGNVDPDRVPSDRSSHGLDHQSHAFSLYIEKPLFSVLDLVTQLHIMI